MVNSSCNFGGAAVSAARWLVASGIVALAFVACDASAADPKPRTVKLVVDYGDGVEKHFAQLKWEAEMTVLDATKQATRHPRGIKISVRGRKATAFVESIDGLENEASGRGWLFKVNGELADRSCGIYELEEGDAVLWTFQNYR